MRSYIGSVLVLGFVLHPFASFAQSVSGSSSVSSVNSVGSSPISPSPSGYYPPNINNNGGIIQGIGNGGSQCGTGISAEIGYGNGSNGNTIYSGSSGIDPNTSMNRSEFTGKIVLRHEFNPCLSQKKQIEMQVVESCYSRKDQFIAQNPTMPIDQLDLRLARFCGGK
jgi:hypothetical protein